MHILDIVGWLTLIVHIVVVFLAIRLYRRKRTLAFGFLLASCISFVVADNSLSIFGFLSGFLGHEAGSQKVFALTASAPRRVRPVADKPAIYAFTACHHASTLRFMRIGLVAAHLIR